MIGQIAGDPPPATHSPYERAILALQKLPEPNIQFRGVELSAFTSTELRKIVDIAMKQANFLKEYSQPKST